MGTTFSAAHPQSLSLCVSGAFKVNEKHNSQKANKSTAPHLPSPPATFLTYAFPPFPAPPSPLPSAPLPPPFSLLNLLATLPLPVFGGANSAPSLSHVVVVQSSEQVVSMNLHTVPKRAWD